MFTNLTMVAKATIFYALAFGMALLLAIFGHGMGEMVGLVTMFTSLAAVLLTLLVVTRDGYTRSGWQILALNRLGLRSWLLAILGPATVIGITYGIVWSLGIARADFSSLGTSLTIGTVLNVLINFAVSFIAAAAEEIGWRGYLLPNLLPLGRVRGLLLSGFLHGLWHLPVMLLTPFYHAEGNRLLVVTLFLLTLTAAGVFYGYLRLMSESVWPAALAHSVLNTVWSTLAAITIPVASPLLLYYLAGESGIITLVSVMILGAWLVKRMQRELPQASVKRTLAGQPIA